MKQFLWIMIILIVFITFYLSWKPKPYLSDTFFVPAFISNWADQQINQDIRTGVPLLMAGLGSGWLLHLYKARINKWAFTFCLLLSLIFLAEIGQLFLSFRSFGWRDIMWGSIGALLGLSLMFLFTYFLKYIPNNKNDV